MQFHSQEAEGTAWAALHVMHVYENLIEAFFKLNECYTKNT